MRTMKIIVFEYLCIQHNSSGETLSNPNLKYVLESIVLTVLFLSSSEGIIINNLDTGLYVVWIPPKSYV